MKGLIHWNIRSLLHPQKLEHVKLLIDQANPDVVVLSETWLKSNVNDDQVALTDFNIFRADRAGRGGGVATYIKSCFTSHTLHSVSVPKCFEFLALKVQYGSKPDNTLIVIGVYRPPSATASSLDQLADLISIYSKSEVIILGDDQWASFK